MPEPLSILALLRTRPSNRIPRPAGHGPGKFDFLTRKLHAARIFLLRTRRTAAAPAIAQPPDSFRAGSKALTGNENMGTDTLY